MTSKRPTLIFDGDCGFCRRWVDMWRQWTGDQVEYLASQKRGDRFPKITEEMVQDSVVYVDSDGKLYQEAEAVFRSLAIIPSKRWLLWCYRKLPGFAPLSNWFYKLVARRRMVFSQWTRWYRGKDPSYHQYFAGRRVFFILLGLIYLVAFLSFGVQIQGLIGTDGILPAGRFLEMVGQRAEHPFWVVPTLFWINSSDLWLQGACWIGAALAVLMMAGFGSLWVSLALWLLYLSLFSVGQVFLGYQWDILLLETGFLAIFLTPLSLFRSKNSETRPSILILWMFRWLLFRLMFQSGIVKLLSGDSSWRDGTAMTYHYWTQPLPNTISYWVHQLPNWVQRETTFLMFLFELGVPFFIFFPNPIRFVAALLILVFQLLILLTGNYGFFNLLAIALCVLLIADRYWPVWLRRRILPAGYTDPKVGRRFWSRFIVVPVSLLIFFLSVVTMERRLDQKITPPNWAQELTYLLSPLHLSNSYGLFAVMTKQRPEITVEGSEDGENWQAYQFRYKPNGPKDIPPILPGHMPRLDWQMWFSGLRPPMRYRFWFDQFLRKLLEGSPAVLGLLKENPFPDKPPKMVRARVANYYFSDSALKGETGDYWVPGPYGPYAPIYEKVNGEVFRRKY